MPDLLLELFSEEIPARMQAKAADDLKKMVTDKLVDAGLVYEGARAFATPRRLALTVQGVPARQPDLKEERKGPRVGAPEGAVAGFLKAAGLSSIDEATIQKDPKKGDFYIALTEKPGRPAIDVIGEILQVVLRTFPWPKSMRWGAQSAQARRLEWVRPLHAIVATFGPETEEPEIVRFRRRWRERRRRRLTAIASLRRARFRCATSATTWRSLEKAKVVLDPARRREIILNDAKNFAFAQGFELVEDENLLNEVAGLVEWPVVLMGTFDEAFLKIPDEVIRATIRNNQKCFVVRDPKTGRLANRFILTANTEAVDGGKAIIAGNERVIRARLSDAKFFYETDLKTKLEDRLPRFKDIIFHEKLGTQAERIERIATTGGRTGAARRRRCREGEARRTPRQDRPAHRSRRRIPRGAGHDGEILRAGAGRGRERRRRESRSTTSRPVRTIACRPIRSRSRSRSPTRSIRWSASGRSTRSRPGARTRMRCAGRRSASSVSSSTTSD